MTDQTHEGLSLFVKLNKDLINALRREHPGGITQNHARFLVDEYYTMQRARIRNGNYVKGLERDARKSDTAAEPHSAIDALAGNYRIAESNIERLLAWYIQEHEMAWFFDATLGIGTVLAAGLCAHIDIGKAPTVGHIWAFAGYDPNRSWEKKTKRPWNAGLKTLCYKIGDSFVKLSHRQDSYYSQHYRRRKAEEWRRNLAGDYQDIARQSHERKRYGKDTDQFAWYTGLCSAVAAAECLEQGTAPSAAACRRDDIGQFPMLSPAHIDMRARRHTVKLFLSHLHECWYRTHYGTEPPKPFSISIQQHAHYLPPPQLAALQQQAA